jgi:transcriptional regulator with GAF, ATPase, and Fis domain
MPVLTIKQPGTPSRTVALVKPVTSVGRGDELDVTLADASGTDAVLAVENDSGRFSVSALEGGGFYLNGKRLFRHTFADGDVVKVGEAEVGFHVTPPPGAPAPEPLVRPPPRPRSGGGNTSDLSILRNLCEFSARLMGTGDIERLLELLIDHVIGVTGADKGFLVLVEGSELHVKVARHLDRQNIADAIERFSDSIVREVLTTKKPLVVSDALTDPKFGKTESVVNLKLSSVMAVPLVDRGGAAFGLIYLGNDRVASLFEEATLELLTVYAAQASLLVKNALLLKELTIENRALKKAAEESRFGDIIGSCEAMRDVYRKLEKIAPTDISVLITGETGTGKELIARELHRRSPRAHGPFVTVNCGAIPENLLESELFGHVKGAFTGAVATRIGRFQAAAGGTLFLDEVGELPPALQVKLLRAIQEKTVTKVGDTKGEAVDIRIVAATNRVLEEEIRQGRFREDLYYRLNVVGLHLPPLRERGEDIEVLARHLLQRYAREYSSSARAFAPNALAALRHYAWPGNIRQLENRLKKAVVLAEGSAVTAEDLDLRPENLEPIAPLANAVEEFKERYIDEVLRRNNENRTKTARDLGVDARTIFRYLERKRARLEGRAPADEDELAADPER